MYNASTLISCYSLILLQRHPPLSTVSYIRPLFLSIAERFQARLHPSGLQPTPRRRLVRTTLEMRSTERALRGNDRKWGSSICFSNLEKGFCVIIACISTGHVWLYPLKPVPAEAFDVHALSGKQVKTKDLNKDDIRA
jgi:hypothetical protein